MGDPYVDCLPALALQFRRRGRLAQRESACFTRKRSQVQTLHRPPFDTNFDLLNEPLRQLATATSGLFGRWNDSRPAPGRVSSS